VLPYATILVPVIVTGLGAHAALLSFPSLMAPRMLEQPAAGERVGRYTMYGEIASGGMGTVHLGRVQGAAGFARTVAIKRLHPHLAREPEFVSMLMDEASMAACIHHPNVVSTLDVVYQGDELLLVMDYVEGETLARLLECSKRGLAVPPPGLPTVITVIADVLFGLHAAHTARSASGSPLEIVHRDVSPHNVMVGTDGIARVHDFGIAKTAHRRYSTRPGQIKGKFAYMAPEQIFGLPVDARTDVFAAGVILWECLAQRRLFFAENLQAIVKKVLAGPMHGPSTWNSTISVELDQIVLKALAPKMEDRFATAEEFAEALIATGLHAKRADVAHWVRETAQRTLAERARLFDEVDGGAVTGVTRVTAVVNTALHEPLATRLLNPNETIRLPFSSIPAPSPAQTRALNPSESTTLPLSSRPATPHARTRALNPNDSTTLPLSSIAATSQAQPTRHKRRSRVAQAMPALAALVGITALTAAVGFSIGRAPTVGAVALPHGPDALQAAAFATDSASTSPVVQSRTAAGPRTAPAGPISDPGGAPVVAVEALMSEREPDAAVAGRTSAATSGHALAGSRAKPLRGAPPVKVARNLNVPAVVTRPPPPPATCEVPYSVDRFGIRRVRRECL
jgi:eukaryotic-like serine/threonine-protein kinase